MTAKLLLQRIAKFIVKTLPANTGFFVLTFDFGDNTNPAQYVSNSRREDVIAAMKEFIERNPMPNQSNN